MGCLKFWSDSFNIMDGIIVLLSWVETMFDILGGSVSGLSAIKVVRVFRMFRVMRIFKLVRHLKALQRLIAIISGSLEQISMIALLLMVFMFMYTLLGMQFFGGLIQKVNGVVPRQNYDSFINAFFTTFQILTTDSWADVMIQTLKDLSNWLSLFFVSWIFFGNYFLMNMFVSIVLDGFASASAEEEAAKKAKDRKKEQAEEKKLAAAEEAKSAVCAPHKEEASEAVGASPDEASSPLSRREREESAITVRPELAQEIFLGETPKTSGTGISPRKATRIRRKSTVRSGNSGSPLSPQPTRRRSSVKSPPKTSENGDKNSAKVAPGDPAYADDGAATGAGGAEDEDEDYDYDDDENENGLYDAHSLGTFRMFCSCRRLLNLTDLEEMERLNVGGEKKAATLAENQFNAARELKKKIESETGEGGDVEVSKPAVEYVLDHVLQPFSVWNIVYSIVAHKMFERFILICIVVSSAFLAWETPNMDPESSKVMILETQDTVFTLIFTCEMCLKIFLLGLWGAPNAYLSETWNRLDCFIVISSLISLIMSGIDISFLRAIRFLRLLRPLRMIGRNAGMKTVINTLFQTIPQMGNVVAVIGLVYVIFGILAVQLWGGKMWYCYNSADSISDWTSIRTKDDCLTAGGEWAKYRKNFDNLGIAMLTLFEVASGENWSDTMYQTIDAVSDSDMPIRDSSIYAGFYFVFFMIVMSFFLYSLFTGVIFDTFTKLRDEASGLGLLAPAQKKWVESQIKVVRASPILKIPRPPKGYRMYAYDIATSTVFELTIVGLICSNILILACSYNTQPDAQTKIVEDINFAFTIVFTGKF
jgi:hypothetical protein